MEKNYKEKAYDLICKYSFSDKEIKRDWDMYCMIEEVCGKKANKYYNALRRNGINSSEALTSLFSDSTDEYLRKSLRDIGPVGISQLRECVNYSLDLIPF